MRISGQLRARKRQQVLRLRLLTWEKAGGVGLHVVIHDALLRRDERTALLWVACVALKLAIEAAVLLVLRCEGR